MEYVRLGRTNLMVSKIGFGGAPAGIKNYLAMHDPSKKDDTKPIIEAIHEAIECGINFYDTAPAYGDGQGEKIFGEAFQGIDPEKICVATKIGINDIDNVRGSVESSLKRLKRDSIDLIQIHGEYISDEDADFILKDGGTIDEMYRLKEEGLIKFIGFTSEDQDPPMHRMIQSNRFDVLQTCYNFIFQHPCDPVRKSGSLYEAKKLDMGTITMRSATSMIFQKWIQKVNPNNTFDYTEALIQFVLSNPLVDVVLIGMRNTEEVMRNIELVKNTSGRIDLDDLHKRIA
jgi:aryl-alcohol dehydrogenase-like predicted oxidoreductase